MTTIEMIAIIVFLMASSASACCSGVLVSLATISIIMPPYFGCNTIQIWLKSNPTKFENWQGFLSREQETVMYGETSIWLTFGR